MQTEEAKKFLSRDEIRKAKDRTAVDVFVEPWGGWVKVRALNMHQRKKMRLNSQITTRRRDGSVEVNLDAEDFEVSAIIYGTVEPEFKESDRDWLLQEKSSGALSIISRVIFDLSGLSPEAEKKSDK